MSKFDDKMSDYHLARSELKRRLREINALEQEIADLRKEIETRLAKIDELRREARPYLSTMRARSGDLSGLASSECAGYEGAINPKEAQAAE